MNPLRTDKCRALFVLNYISLSKEFISSNLHWRGDKISLISASAAEEKPGEEAVGANAERLN